jgi:hypothetical protein
MLGMHPAADVPQELVSEVSMAEARQCVSRPKQVMSFLGLEEVQVSSHTSLDILVVREPSSRVLRAGLTPG